jgi:hypothetical protein
MIHHAKGRYVDLQGRSHYFSIDADQSDRSYIKDLIEARYPAKDVFINTVEARSR